MKKALASFVIFLTLNCALSIHAQTEQSKQKEKGGDSKEQTKDQEEAIKLGVTLVQADVVVTDNKGRFVTDLRAEDFEVFEDGRPQKITNFSYIDLKPNADISKETKPDRAERESIGVPPVRLRAEDVRRTIALVVDDFESSFESVAIIRKALKKFVDEQMEPGDIVAIIRTGAGVGALQQFTSDKKLLHAAIERVRWKPLSRAGISSVPSIESKGTPQVDDNQLTGDASNGREGFDRFDRDTRALGQIGALNLIVRGLRDWPGRKMLMLFSDGISIHDGRETNEIRLSALRQVIELANRASVVVYTFDSRVLMTDFSAADAGAKGGELREILPRRSLTRSIPQDGMNYLSRETGGILIKNTNSLNRGIERVLEDQEGYYLIGYTPEYVSESDRREAKRSKVTIKVKRADLQIRSRSSFYRDSNEPERPANRTPAEQIFARLTSPFTSGDFELKLTSLFQHDAVSGAHLRSMLHIDPRGISFSSTADGWRNGTIDIYAVTFGENGQAVDQLVKSYDIKLREDTFHKIMQEGLIYSIDVPIKRPGAYQLRVVVRDASSERTGSASQFIEVPDLKKKQLALSGIAISGTAAEAALVADVDVMANPAVRRLKTGMFLDYGFAIYNTQKKSGSGQSSVQTQVIIFKDAKRIYTGATVPAEQKPGSDHILVGGRILLGKELEPGEYYLQVIVSEEAGKKKYRRVAQAIDFEIIK